MTRKIGIAFTGAGIVEEMHGRGIADNADTVFVGAYDPDTARAEAITRKYGGRVFSSLSELLSDPLVDAVHVLTPTDRHVPNRTVDSSKEETMPRTKTNAPGMRKSAEIRREPTPL